MAFQDQLKSLLAQREMKAVDLARATGLSEAAISDYLKGKKEPRGRQSIAIAKALNVSLDTLWETDFQTTSNIGFNKNNPNKGNVDNLDVNDEVRRLAEQISLLSQKDKELIKSMVSSLSERGKNQTQS